MRVYEQVLREGNDDDRRFIDANELLFAESSTPRLGGVVSPARQTRRRVSSPLPRRLAARVAGRRPT